MTKYNFLDNNFTTFENVNEPQATKLELPLGEVDISDWGYIGNNGAVIANDNLASNNTTKQQTRFIVDEAPAEEVSLVTTDLKDNVKKAMEFFESKGLKPHQAAGIVGNLIQESTPNLDPKIKGDNGNSIGIAQWNGSRRRNLKSFADKTNSDMYDLNTQLNFLWYEITEDSNEKKYKTLEKLQNSKDVKEATTNFMKTFERPGNPQLENRIKYAQSLLQ